MIRVVARFQFQAGKVPEATALAQELIDLTRKEAGCLQYDLVQATADENLLVVLESWESQAHLDAHSASAHFTTIVPKLAALCTAPPVVETFTVLI